MVKRGEDAQALYHAARSAGQTAALLDQERPNIFRQAVANILPGENIQIEIGYVEMLRYETGSYEFVFPMVVTPRYTPAGVAGARRISPPLAPPGTRAGHDISVEVAIDAGDIIGNVESKTHPIDVHRPAADAGLAWWAA